MNLIYQSNWITRNLKNSCKSSKSTSSCTSCFKFIFLSFKKKKYFTKLTCNQTSQFSRFSNCKKLYISFYNILNTNMLLSDVPLIHYMFLSPTIWLIFLKTRGDFGHRDKWSECFHCRLSIYWNKYWQCRWLLIPVTRLKWL